MEFSKDTLLSLVKKYEQELLYTIIALIVIGVTVGVWFGYITYTDRQDQQAHAAYVSCLKFYNAPVGEFDTKRIDIDSFEMFKTAAEKWNKVGDIAQQKYKEYGDTQYAPLFLALIAEADAYKQKYNTALEALSTIARTIPSPQLKDLYTIKRALVSIDASDKQQLEEGLALLKEFAGKQESAVNDLALYHLGQYYWFEKNWDEARNYWNQLMILYGKKAAHHSIWADKARSKLKLIEA